MFGREARLPIDLAYGIEQNQERQPKSKYVQELRDRLKKAYQLARETASKQYFYMATVC